MIGTAIAFARRNPKLIGGIALVVLIVLVLVGVRQCGARDAIEKRDREDAAAIVTAATQNAQATTAEGVEATTDAATIAAQKKELIDEVDKAPDSYSDGAALRFACGVVRQRTPEGLPADHPCNAANAR